MKISGVFIANVANIFLSSAMLCFLSASMNLLYEIPSWRTAALMRICQSARNSRLRTLRSRYAYVHACISVSFAARYFFDRPHLKPFAASKIFFLRLWAVTPRLTLGTIVTAYAVGVLLRQYLRCSLNVGFTTSRSLLDTSSNYANCVSLVKLKFNLRLIVFPVGQKLLFQFA